MSELTFGFSPCPNDTFAFHALVHGLVDSPARIRPVLLDIEELNRRAHDGELDVTKLSFGALPAVADRYAMLRSGAALGRGVGPLVVAREPLSLAAAAAGPIAIPGRETTAFLLLRLLAPELGEPVELRYDEILGAVARGEVAAGLIIHESRFTYAAHGLVKVADLGEWWLLETGLPLPLGVNTIRRDLGAETMREVSQILRESIDAALANRSEALAYALGFGRGMDEERGDRFVGMYVNDMTCDYGEEGRAAVRELLARWGNGVEVEWAP